MSRFSGSWTFDQVPQAVEHADGLPRPQWERLANWLDQNVPPHEHDAAWHALAGDWLKRLAEAYDEPYRTAASTNFLLMTAEPDRNSEHLLNHAERARVTILRLLPSVASDEGAGPHVILHLANDADYYTYISYFYPEEGAFGGSAGICIQSDGYTHLAVNGTEPIEVLPTITHELTHACLSHLTMPRWLEEGLVQLVEGQLHERFEPIVDRELLARHQAYWQAASLTPFWTGEAFHVADEGQELAYHLAHVLAWQLLEANRDAFLRFACEARWQDAGEAAARQHLGQPLTQLVGAFVGWPET